ncbi:hypothetical protein D3C76_1089230 [compost metagenome]
MQAQHAGDERDHDHRHHQARTDRAEGIGQDRGDRVGVFTGQYLGHVRHRENQRQAREHRCRAADVDGHAHGLGNALARVRGFFRDIAAGLEPVVLEQTRQGGREEGRQVRAIDLKVEGVEQHADRLMTLEDQQVATDQDRPDQLAEKAEHCHPCQQLGAHQIQRGGQQDDRQGDDDVGIRAGIEAQHDRQVRPGTHSDPGDGGA